MTIKLQTFIFVLVLFAILLFAAINWPLMIQTNRINLVFATIVAPLGGILLTMVGVLTLLYLLFLARSETDALLRNRRTANELEEARKLALRSEESRYSALRDELQERLAGIEGKLNSVLDRLAEHDRDGRGDGPIVVNRGPTRIDQEIR